MGMKDSPVTNLQHHLEEVMDVAKSKHASQVKSQTSSWEI